MKLRSATSSTSTSFDWWWLCLSVFWLAKTAGGCFDCALNFEFLSGLFSLVAIMPEAHCHRLAASLFVTHPERTVHCHVEYCVGARLRSLTHLSSWIRFFSLLRRVRCVASLPRHQTILHQVRTESSPPVTAPCFCATCVFLPSRAV